MLLPMALLLSNDIFNGPFTGGRKEMGKGGDNTFSLKLT
jgi:hypothetical protein